MISEIEFRPPPLSTTRGKGVNREERDYADAPTPLLGNEELQEMETLGDSPKVKANQSLRW